MVFGPLAQGFIWALVGGAVTLGGLVAWTRRTRAPAAKRETMLDPRLTPSQGLRALSLASLRDPVSAGDRPAARERELADDLRGYLGDVAAQHGADDAMLWIRPGEVAAFHPVAWNHDAMPPHTPWGSERHRSLVTWAAGEGVVSFDTADGPPSLVASRVPLESIAGLGAGADATGALVLHSASGIRGDRSELRLWLPRHAERLAQLVELQVTRNEVARQNRRMRALMYHVQGFQTAGEQDALERRIAESMLEASGAGYGALVRWDFDTGSGTVRHATADYPDPAPKAGAKVEAASLVGGVCTDGTPRLWEDASVLPRSEHLFSGGGGAPRVGTLAILPLQRGTVTIGALVIGSPTPATIRPNDLRTARLFARLAASALEAAWEIEEVSRRSRTDALTGLWNRGHFDEQLARVLSETDRFGGNCAMVVGDLDLFKDVNDTYGHEAGDEVLKRVADVMRDVVRSTDTCARIGGEEFCIILPQTSLTGAVELAERLRSRMAEATVRWREHAITFTASFGIAIYAAGSGPVLRSGLFQAADRALYRAKREGRNCVRIEGVA